MTKQELSAKTVIELRKMAKTYGVTLGAGLSKEGIVNKLFNALGDNDDLPELSAPAQSPVAELPAAAESASAEDTQADVPAVELPSEPAAAEAESARENLEGLDDDDEAEDKLAEAKESSVKPASATPQFRAAWHNPSTPRYSSKPAYQASAYPQRQGWQGGAPRQGDQQRSTAVRPSSYTVSRFGPNAADTPRFGPGASETPRFGPGAEPAPGNQEEFRGYRSEAPRSSYGVQPDRRTTYADSPRPYYGQRGDDRQSSYDSQRSAYDARTTYDNQRPSYDRQSSYDNSRGFDNSAPSYGSGAFDSGYRYNNRSAYSGAPRRDSYYNQDAIGTPNPAVSEMLAVGEFGEGSGVLELHPDGYGFLRSETFQSSGKDIYVSMAQIRRFGLRPGDRVAGKTRPQRDGDRYNAMLYITSINGESPEAMAKRPVFEELTPIYPKRRIDLESHGGAKLDDMRLTDLIAPLGFGQRALLICPQDTNKTTLLQDFANVITANHPDVKVMALLLNECPEDVTAFREQANCQVLASTFDQAPENHLRLADMVLEHAMRQVELGKDVVLLVDSLTLMAKVYTTATQQNRSIPGQINPSSLFKAKRLFGAARCLREGGSLTVIAAMNIENGNRIDDTVVEEFKGTANMELVLDSSLARAGVNPPINLQLSGTKHVERLLDETQLEGLKLVRSMVGTTRASTAIPQLLSLMDKAETNDALLVKIKDWVALMDKNR